LDFHPKAAHLGSYRSVTSFFPTIRLITIGFAYTLFVVPVVAFEPMNLPSMLRHSLVGADKNQRPLIYMQLVGMDADN